MTARDAPKRPAPERGSAPLLAVRDLRVTFALDDHVVHAVSGVSFDVPEGRTVALVGESGSGKTATALSILRLVPCPPGSIDGGAILFEGRDLLTLPERELRAVRGGAIGMVFQEPLTALNPVYAIGAQIAEAIRLHEPVSRGEARRRAIDLLAEVGLPSPAQAADRYPHELSGGMRQRALIAIAIACRPKLLVADEPTSALDTTTQAQILDRLRRLREERGMSLLLVAHDLALVAEIADDVVVMYAGRAVERGPAAEVLRTPRHPYTRALLRCIPPVGARAYRKRGAPARRLPTIEGAPPDLRTEPAGCAFAERCPDVQDRCRDAPPPLVPLARSATEAAVHVRCVLHESAASGGALGAEAAS